MHTGDLVEVNSGGQVLFCFFAPAGTSAGHHQRAAQSVDLGNLHRSSMPSPLHNGKQPRIFHSVSAASCSCRQTKFVWCAQSIVRGNGFL